MAGEIVPSGGQTSSEERLRREEHLKLEQVLWVEGLFRVVRVAELLRRLLGK